MTRRPVRVTDEFYADLDGYLGPERGPNGEPSAADFLRFELLPFGRLVAYISIMGMRQADGSVELVQLELDLGEIWPE